MHVHAVMPASNWAGSDLLLLHMHWHMLDRNDRRHTGLSLLQVVLNTFPDVTACAVLLQALPRRVLGPSAAPPARGLPSRAGSATLTPVVQLPGKPVTTPNGRELCKCAGHALGFQQLLQDSVLC